MDYSKGSIERRVKKRKCTERDHNDSDFILPKLKKKTIEETFPQPMAQISDPDFGKAEKGDTQPKIRKLIKCTAYRNLQPQKQSLIKFFFGQSHI